MKFRRIFLTCLLLGESLANADSVNLKIIGFNDFHGNLESPGSFGVQALGPGSEIVEKPAGGVDILAAYFYALKKQQPNSILVSAGDLIGASPLISGLFHDEPTIEIMNRLGLAFSATGNHEFDEGAAELLRMQYGGCRAKHSESCMNSRFQGAKFKFLAANVHDNSGKNLFPAYAIKTFSNKTKKLSVAFIGVALAQTPHIVAANGIKGLNFIDEAEAVNSVLPALRAQGIKAIVVLVHLGGEQHLSGKEFINDCTASLLDPELSPITAMVGKLEDDVDLVISGHSHSGFICRMPNKTGRLINVTQAASFGRVLSDIDLRIDRDSGDVLEVSAQNITVDRENPAYAADSKIHALVAKYAKAVQPLTAKVLGSIASQMPNAADSNGEMALGELIADAQLQATQAPKRGNAQIALINPGGIRGPGLMADAYPYAVSYGLAFSLQPFGNHLVTLNLSAQQLKDLLEQQFVGNDCLLSDGVTKNRQNLTRILQVSKGFHVEWRESAPACAKIQNVWLDQADETGTGTRVNAIISDGKVVQPSQTLRVTVNNYLAAGGDNFSIFPLAHQQQIGIGDIAALSRYLAAYHPPAPAYDPNAQSLNKPRLLKQP